MSISALLDMIPQEQRAVIRHVEDGVTRVEMRQDVGPVAACAKFLSENHKPDKDFTRVALIPKVVIDQAFIEGWFHDEEAWRRWANDSANAQFRTTRGTI